MSTSETPLNFWKSNSVSKKKGATGKQSTWVLSTHPSLGIKPITFLFGRHSPNHWKLKSLPWYNDKKRETFSITEQLTWNKAWTQVNSIKVLNKNESNRSLERHKLIEPKKKKEQSYWVFFPLLPQDFSDGSVLSSARQLNWQTDISDLEEKAPN